MKRTSTSKMRNILSNSALRQNYPFAELMILSFIIGLVGLLGI